jgi:hypothetical protein
MYVMDRIENIMSNSSVVAGKLTVAETCLPSYYLAIAVSFGTIIDLGGGGHKKPAR